MAERVKLTKCIFSFKIFIEGLEPKHMSITLVLLCKSFSFKLKQRLICIAAWRKCQGKLKNEKGWKLFYHHFLSL